MEVARQGWVDVVDQALFKLLMKKVAFKKEMLEIFNQAAAK